MDVARIHPHESRHGRGIALAQARFWEIERIAPWTWSVPSCTGDHRYTVDLKHGGCGCPDAPPRGERCKHETAARYVKAKTATCVGCGGLYLHRDLYEAGDDNLAAFEGDLFCEACAGNVGVL